ncbi:ARM repeat-containing protein [Mycena kentingensis (nom. inval.)]|nr:ARM repeat-containing protein [Mycena kentingensis (nom. inval.)]
MHVILTGATGLVGGYVLRACLAEPAITQLSILSRRNFTLPTDLDATKARIFVHTDYTSYAAVSEELKGASACIWAQGISQTRVSKEQYIRITHDYPLAAAKAFSGPSDAFNFVHVSGEHADWDEKAPRLFHKIKGRAEKNLRGLSSDYHTLRVFNVRPGYVEPSNRASLTFGRRLLHGVASPIFHWVQPLFVCPTDALARVLVDLAIGNGEGLAPGPGIEDEGRLVRCIGVRRLQGLSYGGTGHAE